MAVPKKRTSKMKKRSRKSKWKSKAEKETCKSLSLGKSILNNKNTSFIYNLYENE